MTILTAANLGHSYGADDLFSNISVQLARKDRVGLVGPNGIGKTTLLLILAGLLTPRQGSVQRLGEFSLGYLRQEAVLTFAGQENSLYEEMLTVFDDLRQQEQVLRQMEARMAAGETDESLLEEYGRFQESYEIGGGYDYHVAIRRVLTGLGFSEEEWQMPLTHLSGGQKTRALLGRLLLEAPDLLILDEPTNHLDMAAVEWLERTLRTWSGSLLIVSHDRYFLDKIVNQVWEMGRSYLKAYRGNYTSYVQQRQLFWEREEALFEAEKARLEKELDWIKRHIAGGKSDMAKGKLKRLTRDLILMQQVSVGTPLSEMQNKSWLEIGGRTNPFGVNEAASHLRRLQSAAVRPPRLNIRLQAEQQSSRTALRGQDLLIGYPDTPLFTAESFKVRRNDCVALIGPNGSGKSTLLRTFLGELEPLDGDYILGDNLQPGYFAQAHDQLNLDNRVLDELLQAYPMTEQEGRSYLAQYLFRGDDVFKQVSALSGGERGRLALALLAQSGANFLLLDEPTNHLDIPSQEILQAVLEEFDGTILLVSHDRYLVDRLATQIWALEAVEDAATPWQLRVYEGSYEDYLNTRAAADEDAETSKIAAPTTEAAPAPQLDWVAELVAPPPPFGKRERQKMERRLLQLEEEIAEAELWRDQVELELAEAQARQDEDEIDRLDEELDAVLTDLERMSEEWADLSQQLV
jgi:ATP-binding cassette, subfamily F, member 3